MIHFLSIFQLVLELLVRYCCSLKLVGEEQSCSSKLFPSGNEIPLYVVVTGDHLLSDLIDLKVLQRSPCLLLTIGTVVKQQLLINS